MDREKVETYALAFLGGLQGAFRYYVRPEISSKRSWIALAGFVALHDFVCPEGETLSEGVDRALERNPLLTQVAIGYTAAHLLNILPPNLDLFHQVTNLRGSNETPPASH